MLDELSTKSGLRHILHAYRCRGFLERRSASIGCTFGSRSSCAGFIVLDVAPGAHARVVVGARVCGARKHSWNKTAGIDAVMQTHVAQVVANVHPLLPILVKSVSLQEPIVKRTASPPDIINICRAMKPDAGF